MNTDPAPNNGEMSVADPLVDSARRARRSWRRLGLRILSITPAGLARCLLVVGGLAGLCWLAWDSWPALAPFVVGGVLAYVLLPLVDWLDRYVPRMAAVLLSMLVVAAILVLFVVLLVPALAEEVARLAANLPSEDQLVEYVDQLIQYLGTLPEPVPQLVEDVLAKVAITMRDNLDVWATELARFALDSTLNLIETVGFVLGFLIVPAWLVFVLNDQRKGMQALRRILPHWMQPDFWAILGIFDRAFRHFVQGQAALSVFVMIITYLGLLLFGFLGLSGVRYELLLAMFAGFMYLIPGVGPMVALIPAVLLSLLYSWETALAVLALYLAIQQVVIGFVQPRIERRVVDVHPALLFMVVVALGQLGLLWMLLAAPVAAIGRDLFRYVYGRLGEPPRPAGLLPGEALPSPSDEPPAPEIPISSEEV